METTSEKIETRAHDLFVERNGNTGSQLEDWLKAEQEIGYAAEKASSSKAILSSVIDSQAARSTVALDYDYLSNPFHSPVHR